MNCGLYLSLMHAGLVYYLCHYVEGKVETGTHCSRMRKNLRKRVSKRIRE